MMKNIEADVCVIGAGSGGLSVAAGTAQLGLKTVLIEADKMGGDCLNAGCVPSKALLAAAKQANHFRAEHITGIAKLEPTIDFANIKKHVSSVIKTIEPNDSVERFEKLGVKVIKAKAHFLNNKQVVAGDNIITARYMVIATGSRAIMPPIKGLEDIDKTKIFTNENIFSLKEKPGHLIIIGGGPIGIEMAQAHVRLGCPVSVITHSVILPKDDAAAVNIVKQQLMAEGVAFYEQVNIQNITENKNNLLISLVNNKGRIINLDGTHLLLAAGRGANIADLKLDQADIKTNGQGIIVNKKLRTNQKNIFAIGDCNGGPQFTHAAGYQAGIIIRQLCFKLPAAVDYTALPWVTYTDPELAQVGLSEAMAKKKYGKNYKVATWHFKENDRAVAEANTLGFIKIITDKKGRVVGGTMVSPHAGDMILTVGLAISKKLKLADLAGMIAPYPTRGEIIKRAAGNYYTPILFSDRTRRLVKWLQYLPF